MRVVGIVSRKISSMELYLQLAGLSYQRVNNMLIVRDNKKRLSFGTRHGYLGVSVDGEYVSIDHVASWDDFEESINFKDVAVAAERRFRNWLPNYGEIQC